MLKNQAAAAPAAQHTGLKNVRILATSALLAAISVVLARLIIPMPNETTRFSLEAVPIFIAGMLFGPIPGALVGFVADHVLHQRHQLLHGRVLAGAGAGRAVLTAVMGVGMLRAVGVEVGVIVGMFVVVGMLMGMGVLMLVVMAAVSDFEKGNMRLSVVLSSLEVK